MTRKKQIRTRIKRLQGLKITLQEAKFDGFEPTWESLFFDESTRKTQLMRALNWYHHYGEQKLATKIILDYLKKLNRKESIRFLKKVPDGTCPNTIAWLIRMSERGWPLNEYEQQCIENGISTVVEKGMRLNEETNNVKSPLKPTIQDRIKEKTLEVGGELEGMLDQYISEGSPTKHNYQAIEILKVSNISYQHIPNLIAHWEDVRNEYQLAYKGKDSELKKGYQQFGKIQLRNLIKFSESIIADLNSYITYKKVSKTPRKRKQKTPEQLVFRLKYLPAFNELNLISIKPIKIIGSSEIFVYSIKKRKLQYYIADPHCGNELSVKNNTIIGFDPSKSVAKTIHKPNEQIKEFMSASRPKSRKFFADIEATETKLSGRFADDLIILKVF